MKNKSISPAVWLFPLAAVLLAVVLVIIGFVGWKLWDKYANLADGQDVETPVEELQLSEEWLKDPTKIPPDVLEKMKQAHQAQLEAAEGQPLTPVPVKKVRKPRREVPKSPYEAGIAQCKQYKTFPCAWEDDKSSPDEVKQYRFHTWNCCKAIHVDGKNAEIP